jgi:lipoate-protein ligase A
MIKKALLPTNDLYVQFTEDELKALNIEPDDKFNFKLQDDGSVKLEKYVKLELDMAEWPREVLEFIVKESCERDISVNDVINSLLKQALEDFPSSETVKVSSQELLLEKDYLYNAQIDPSTVNADTSITNA